jgi:hypothetical protein
MDKFFKYTRSIVAFLIVVFSFGFLFLIAIRTIPAANKDILQIAAGLVLGVLATVAAYYFGSSKDKSDQDKVNQKPV